MTADLVTGLIFERAAEWDGVVQSPESVERSLELLLLAVKRWQSTLSSYQARREAFAAIHVLAVVLMAQFYVRSLALVQAL